MLLKLGIIGTFLILGGMMFSTEISALFPNTSASFLDSVKNDINLLNEKIGNSAEERLDTSVDSLVENVSDQVYAGITETGDSLVENVSDQVYAGITETGDSLKNEIIPDEIFGFDFITNLLRIN